LIKEREGEKGTRVHDFAASMFRAMMQGREIDLTCDEDILEPVTALVEWTNKHNVQPVAVEERVWVDEFGGYAGTLDLVAYVDDVLLTVDLKSSKGMYDEHPLQVASYDFAWCNRNPDKQTDGMGVLILHKDTGLPEFFPFTKDETMDYVFEFGLWVMIWHCREKRAEKANQAKALIKEAKRAEKAEVKPKAKAKEAEPAPEADPY
jgi:hypothetical protein